MEIDKIAQDVDLAKLDLSEKKAEMVRTHTFGAELAFDEDRLKIYYNRIFPYKLMF
jgi:hypothetical protein